MDDVKSKKIKHQERQLSSELNPLFHTHKDTHKGLFFVLPSAFHPGFADECPCASPAASPAFYSVHLPTLHTGTEQTHKDNFRVIQTPSGWDGSHLTHEMTHDIAAIQEYRSFIKTSLLVWCIAPPRWQMICWSPASLCGDFFPQSNPTNPSWCFNIKLVSTDI